ncbi:hypothetical protein OB955_04760 [Halobacteria archaeon AArc-m2/3/4]|uniref:Uncharacterized protein n=1 Tax=Natronoglomus mannanivorans TaxID=2979990 RepID=A0ABT2QAU3_9EURY|nr:hypothetical protein [Halobacteria archaeon AArc-m2/3/4]
MTESFTLRVSDEDTRRDLRRTLDRLELDHEELWDADADEIGEAIVRLAVDNPDLLKLKLDEVSDDE